MQKHKFSWCWVNAWPKYKLDGEPFFALISPAIWERVTESRSGDYRKRTAEPFQLRTAEIQNPGKIHRKPQRYP